MYYFEIIFWLFFYPTDRPNLSSASGGRWETKHFIGMAILEPPTRCGKNNGMKSILICTVLRILLDHSVQVQRKIYREFRHGQGHDSRVLFKCFSFRSTSNWTELLSSDLSLQSYSIRLTKNITNLWNIDSSTG